MASGQRSEATAASTTAPTKIAQLPAGRYRFCYYWLGHPDSRQYYRSTFRPSEAKVFEVASGQELTSLNVVVWGDTQRPSTSAKSGVSVRRGSKASLTYRVTDKGRHGPTADVAIRIRTLSGKTVKTIRRDDRPVNTWRRLIFICDLPKGRYRYRVLATDLGGNHQRRSATGALVVR